MELNNVAIALMPLVALAATVVFIWFVVKTPVQIWQAVQRIDATLERAFPGTRRMLRKPRHVLDKFLEEHGYR